MHLHSNYFCSYCFEYYCIYLAYSSITKLRFSHMLHVTFYFIQVSRFFLRTSNSIYFGTLLTNISSNLQLYFKSDLYFCTFKISRLCQPSMSAAIVGQPSKRWLQIQFQSQYNKSLKSPYVFYNKKLVFQNIFFCQ